MRVAVFGAAGRLGRRVLSLLIRLGGIDYLLAADNDTRGLSDLQASLGHLGVIVRYLEAGERRSYAERMSACDAVVSCLGGKGTDEFPLAVEAVERGCLYLSSSADPDVFRRRKSECCFQGGKGGTAVMGVGWSPGLSGLLSARLGARFRRLDSLDIRWCADVREMNSPGGLEELLLAFGGRCPSFLEGNPRMVRAGSWEEWACFPPRSAVCGVTHVRSPEPLTLPLLFPEVLRVQVKGGLAQPRLQLPLHTLSWACSQHGGAYRDLFMHAAGLALRGAGPPEGNGTGSALMVEAAGVSEGKRKKIALGATGSRLEATAAVLVGALARLSASGGASTGILAPEEALRLADILPSLRSSGVRFWAGP